MFPRAQPGGFFSGLAAGKEMTELTETAIQLGGLVVLSAIGYVGFKLFKKFRLPAAALLGSMVALGALGLAGFSLPFPVKTVSFISKILSGIVVGQRIDRHTVRFMKTLWLPALLASGSLVIGSIVTGYLLYYVAGGKLDLITSVVSSSAGGISEMSIFAMSVGADVGTVAFFQTIRVFSVAFFMPAGSRFWLKRMSPQERALAFDQGRGNSLSSDGEPLPRYSRPGLVLLALVCCLCGWTVDSFGMPAGVLVGAILGSAGMNLSTGRGFTCPNSVKVAAQIGLSMVIGRNLTPQTLHLIASLFLPLCISLSFLQAWSFVLGWVLRKISHWDPVTCLMASCPGGLSQVVFLAEDMGADSLRVSVMHTMRMVSIVLFVPLLTKLFIL